MAHFEVGELFNVGAGLGAWRPDPAWTRHDLVVMSFTPALDEDVADGFDIDGYLVVKPT